MFFIMYIFIWWYKCNSFFNNFINFKVLFIHPFQEVFTILEIISFTNIYYAYHNNLIWRQEVTVLFYFKICKDCNLWSCILISIFLFHKLILILMACTWIGFDILTFLYLFILIQKYIFWWFVIFKCSCIMLYNSTYIATSSNAV